MSAPSSSLAFCAIDLFRIGFTQLVSLVVKRGVTVSQRALESPRQASERRERRCFACQVLRDGMARVRVTTGTCACPKEPLLRVVHDIVMQGSIHTPLSRCPTRSSTAGPHDHHRASRFEPQEAKIVQDYMGGTGAVMIMVDPQLTTGVGRPAQGVWIDPA